MKEIASKRGGECLSIEYISKNIKLKWKCKEGHTWYATPDSVKNASRWCPVCGGSMPLSLEEMQNIAKSRNGKCLSTKYINARISLTWECSEGHQWENTPQKIKAGQWCPYCAEKAPLRLVDLNELAKIKGGKCLSTDYVNSQTHLIWECTEGHQWKTTARTIKHGAWCPYCANRAQKSFEELNNVAKQRGGRLISKEIKNNKFKLSWECKYLHLWDATPNAVLRGQWCPTCSDGLGERISREFFEQFFKLPFHKAHPSWLRSKSGSILELDGYNKHLGLAFEHQGMQHYKHLKRFHKTNDDFENQLLRDSEKKEMCIKNGIKLILIPEVPFLTPIEKLKSFLAEELNKCGFLIDKVHLEKINLNIAYASNSTIGFNNKLKIEVERKGGKLISENYLGTATKIEFECSEGHRWKTKPNLIFSGRWCPHCAGNIKYTLTDIKKYAHSKGGKCLSTSYFKANEKLLWECSKGHQWYIALSNVINANSWCPICREKEIKVKFLAEMNSLAKKKEGLCLSTEYVNSGKQMKWKCKNGHIWEALLGNIRAGYWCPKCRGK